LSPYEAAIELCKAVDTHRVLVRAGMATDEDAYRVALARARFEGSPAPRGRRYLGRRG
jgi:hypothetical protein